MQNTELNQEKSRVYTIANSLLAGMTVMTVQSKNEFGVNSNAPDGDTIIEYAARLCYNSHDKMHSTGTFLDGLITAGHLDVFEHAAIVLSLDVVTSANFFQDLFDLKNRFPYAQVVYTGNMDGIYNMYIGTNYRVALEMIWEAADGDANELLCEVVTHLIAALSTHSNIFYHRFFDESVHGELASNYTKQMNHLNKNYSLPDISGNYNIRAKVHMLGDTIMLPETPSTFRHTSFLINDVSRAYTHQHVRHRLLSHSQMSQRYVDYSKQVNGDSESVIKRLFIIPDSVDLESYGGIALLDALDMIMLAYNRMRGSKTKKEDARIILPNAAITHIVSSAYEQGWLHYFKLRCAKDAQQEIREVAEVIQDMYNEGSNG